MSEGEPMAVGMLRLAFEHLPAERAAGALALAGTEKLEAAFVQIAKAAYEEGLRIGIARGRVELAEEMESDWKPLAERVRAQAGSPSHEEVQCRRNGCSESNYTGGPVAPW